MKLCEPSFGGYYAPNMNTMNYYYLSIIWTPSEALSGGYYAPVVNILV